MKQLRPATILLAVLSTALGVHPATVAAESMKASQPDNPLQPQVFCEVAEVPDTKGEVTFDVLTSMVAIPVDDSAVGESAQEAFAALEPLAVQAFEECRARHGATDGAAPAAHSSAAPLAANRVSGLPSEPLHTTEKGCEGAGLGAMAMGTVNASSIASETATESVAKARGAVLAVPSAQTSRRDSTYTDCWETQSVTVNEQMYSGSGFNYWFITDARGRYWESRANLVPCSPGFVCYSTQEFNWRHASWEVYYVELYWTNYADIFSFWCNWP